MFPCADSPEAPTASAICALGFMEAGALTPPSTGPDLLITEFGGPTTVLADKDCISEEAFLRELDLDAFAYTGLGIFPD